MCLPRLPVLVGYKDKTYTNVKLAPGLIGSVVFEPWPEFDSFVVKTKTAIDNLPWFINAEPKSTLQGIRQKLDPESFTDESGIFERSTAWFEKKQTHRRPSLEDDGTNTDAKSKNCKTLQPGSSSQTHPIEPIRECEDGVNIFSENRMVDADRSVDQHNLLNRGIVTPSDSDGNIGASMTKSTGTTDAKELQEEPLQQAEEKGIRSFTNSTSCGSINKSTFDVVEQLVRGIFGGRYYFMLSGLQLNSEIARKYDLLPPKALKGPDDFCSLIPDYAFTRNSTAPPRDLPICSFELKGPLRQFWKVGDSQGRASRKRRRLVHGDNTDCTPVDSSDKTYRDMNRDGKVEKIVRLARAEEEYNYSAKGLAEYYEYIFNSEPAKTGQLPGSLYSYAFLPVAQDISQALLSDSGCCALYNHDEAVVFHVWKIREPASKDKLKEQIQVLSQQENAVPKTPQKPLLVIRVSKAYACDAQPGNICALTALAWHSWEETESNKQRKLEVRRLFRLISKTYMERKLQGASAQKKRPSKSDQSKGNRGSGAAEGGKQASFENAQSSKDERHWTMRNENSDIGTSTNISSSTNSSPSKSLISGASASSSSSSDFSRKEDILSEPTDLLFSKTLMKVVRNNFGVIGSGDTSSVIGGMLEGRMVAIKSWNGVSKAGIECLLKEIQIYRALIEQKCEVVVTGIPALRMSRIFPRQDAAMILDYVGHGIYAMRDGGIVLEEREKERKLRTEDVEKVSEAAMESLRMLHRASVLHGDVSLRNLRVQNCDALKGEQFWRAWWIELGQSTMGVSSPACFDRELK